LQLDLVIVHLLGIDEVVGLHLHLFQHGIDIWIVH
jgi:hypothetical protein